jgi:hypothetical protein
VLVVEEFGLVGGEGDELGVLEDPGRGGGFGDDGVASLDDERGGEERGWKLKGERKEWGGKRE